jgi:hypothetical protein
MVCLAPAASGVRAGSPPAWLPRYELDLRLDPTTRTMHGVQRVTFTNHQKLLAAEVVFNAHGRYTIPDKDVGTFAKIIEVLRLAPKETMYFDGPPLEVQRVALVDPKKLNSEAVSLTFGYAADNATALVAKLPESLPPGASVTLELQFTFKVPAKKGRWGQWTGITTLAQWLPTLAVWTESGWKPSPFVPWHQPFCNEAGYYSGRIRLPCDQKLACSCAILETRDVGEGWLEYELAPAYLRDFSLVASARFVETKGWAGKTLVRCLHLPEHAFYAKVFVETACEAIPVYEKWFGPYPYPQFTIAEAVFGWNGNECGAMVLIDDRMFSMPHIGTPYPVYLLQHELCHQWWYNVVGTDGYAESWMDEGLASYLSHRLADRTLGKNNTIIKYPKGLGWLPNIHRDDLRNYGYMGARARGAVHPTVQAMEKFEHLPNLLATVYDRGAKIVGLLEERLGETAFLDFLRVIYSKYQFRILRVADFQRELEEYTGRSWHDFFQYWVYGSGMCDWKVRSVSIDGKHHIVPRLHSSKRPVRAVIELEQQGGFNEPTVLGFRMKREEGFVLRIPIDPQIQLLTLDDCGARVTCVTQTDDQGRGTCRATVEIDLASTPDQIAVDPDRMLLDEAPMNNYWKKEVRLRLTPVYTQLEEIDVTNSFDKLNLICGPWLATPTYTDPWYQRSYLAGFKAGFYRTQEMLGGAYVAYRTNDRNIIAGADVLWDHVPWPQTQVGLSIEKSLMTLWDEDVEVSRGVAYGRYIMQYGASLYMPPVEYVELFGAVQNRSLPNPSISPPGADLFSHRSGVGIHYHKNYLTPYWDPEGGVALDATYQCGIPCVGTEHPFHLAYGQVSTVKWFPKSLTSLWDHPISSYLELTRFAFRLGGAFGWPERGQFFTLGGGDWFRGFDLSERQGNLIWLASVEWRLPIAEYMTHDFVDHIFGVRNIYVAPFYDVGNAYILGEPLGPTAHALGLGLRVDIALLGLIERTMLRLDVAKTINVDSPVQFWLGIQHPF